MEEFDDIWLGVQKIEKVTGSRDDKEIGVGLGMWVDRMAHRRSLGFARDDKERATVEWRVVAGPRRFHHLRWGAGP